jgi:hypothetical protein
VYSRDSQYAGRGGAERFRLGGAVNRRNPVWTAEVQGQAASSASHRRSSRRCASTCRSSSSLSLGPWSFQWPWAGRCGAATSTKLSAWLYAVRSIGVEGPHVHDLRHTGNTSACLITELRQEFEIFHVGEDAVVRHERNLEPDRGGGHPAIRLMLLLAQAVPGPDTPCPERRICLDKVWPRPHDLCPCNLVIQPSEPPRSPPSQPWRRNQARRQ